MRVFLRGVFLIVLLPWAVHAQWMTQTVELEKGWNAVFLRVQPVPSSCDTVFEGAPVERIDMWGREKGGAEFSTDVQEDILRPSHWLVWRPSSNPQSSLNDFSQLLAGRSYLIKTSAAATLQIKGRAMLVHPAWLPNEMSLTGLPTGTGASFADFFSHTDEIGVDFSDGGEIYSVLANGTEQQVYRPSTTIIQPGKAYWIKTGQILEYDGPLRVTLSDGDSWIDYGSHITPRTLKIQNVTPEARDVSLELLDTESPPAVDGDANAYPSAEGPVPLSTIQVNAATMLPEYVPFTGVISTNVAPHSTLEIQLMPRANEMQSADEGAIWQSILKVSDADGELLQFVGIQCAQESEETVNPQGLWVGEVSVNAVSRAPSRIGASNVWDTVTPVPVSRPYSFRVLLHVSTDGQCRLLQRAIPVWVPSDEAQPETKIFTDAEYVEQYVTDHPDAEVARISSAVFPLMDPVEMTGEFGGTDSLSVQVFLPYDDPVNPFVHPFHPDHDNKKDLNGTMLPLAAGEESFDVVRDLEFTFSASDPLGANPNWGISEQGGVFRESVTGLNKTIYTEGTFRLQKISDCGILSYLDQN